MPETAEKAVAKEREIVIETRTAKQLDGGKKVWEFTDADGLRYSVWSEEMQKDMQEGSSVKIKFVESKNGKFINRTVKAACFPEGEGWGKWIEDAKPSGFSGGAKGGFTRSFGKSPAEQEAIIMQTCLKTAGEVYAAVLRGTTTAPNATGLASNVVAIAKAFKSELFTPKAVTGSVASNGAKKAATEEQTPVPF